MLLGGTPPKILYQRIKEGIKPSLIFYSPFFYWHSKELFIPHIPILLLKGTIYITANLSVFYEICVGQQRNSYLWNNGL
ncbi:hypothetical protein DHC50_20525 [Arenibacter sp. A80]|nr:hypothetical protein [Arenibacter sp. A80]RFT54379.1 hypothetical protein D0S24_20520 [Arenibacter sp. P308M17]